MTRFRIASLSKTVTAVAVLRMCETGPLSLDDTVFGDAGVLGGLVASADLDDPAVSEITVRHLLQHTAGAATSTVFWTISRVFLSAMPPRTCRVTHTACCPCVVDADWCL